MAKLTGPLLSHAAHGTVAGIMTHSHRTSCNLVRYQKKQHDFTSLARYPVRAHFATAAGWWHQLSAAEKDTWRTIGNYD